MHTSRPTRRLAALLIIAFVAGTATLLGGAAPRSAHAMVQPFVGVTPQRLLETRSGAGSSTVDGLQLGTGAFTAGQTRTVPVLGRGTIPLTGVAAVALNVTAIGPTANGFITVFPTGATQPTASNLNTAPGRTVPNMVIVPLGGDGTFSIFNSAGSTHLAVDVLGWFPVGGAFEGAVPQRLLDSRANGVTVDGQQQATGTLTGGTTRTLPVLGRGTVPSSGVGAVVLNVTAIGPTATGFITVFPTGTSQPTASNLNTAAGRTLPNMVIVPVGDDGSISIFNSAGATHLAVDVLGWFPSGSAFNGISPQRLLDTRANGVTIDGQQQNTGAFGANVTRELTIAGRGAVPANGAGAVALNVTAIGPTATGFITVFPTGASRPTASNLNTAAGRTLPNMVIVPLGTDGKISIFNSAGATHLAVDVLGWFPAPAAPDTSVVTRAIDDLPRGGVSLAPTFSRNGNKVVFLSLASNLVAGDTNGVEDVFVVDVATGDIVRASLADDDTQLAQASATPRISDDGRFVTFDTVAVAASGDTNAASDVYRRDLQTGTTVRMSLAPNGSQMLSASRGEMSGDGNVVTFVGAVSATTSVFVRDVSAATTVLVSDGAHVPAGYANGSGATSISQNGDKIAITKQFFNSTIVRIFLYDRSAGTMTQMSPPPSGGAGTPEGGGSPVLSDDGTAVIYERDNHLFWFKAGSPEQRIDVSTALVLGNGNPGRAEFAGSGYDVIFDSEATNLVSGDTNGTSDVFLRTTGATKTTTRLSVRVKAGFTFQSSGVSRDAAMSSDGTKTVFQSNAIDFAADATSGNFNLLLGDTNGASYRSLDRATFTTVAHGASDRPRLTPDGRFVVFDSGADDIISGDFEGGSDTFLLDRATGQYTRIGLRSNGTLIDGGSTNADVSDDGRTVLFHASGDAFGVSTSVTAAFVRDLDTGTVDLVSGASPFVGANAAVIQSALSGNGRFVVFSSGASNIVTGDTNAALDVFVHDRETGTVERVSLTDADAQITGSTTVTASPSISADGRFVAWTTNAPNVVPGAATTAPRVFVRDRLLGTTTLVALAASGTISDDGSTVVLNSSNALLAADTNGTFDVYVKDLVADTLELASVSSAEVQGNGSSASSSISADGRFVTFNSAATNLVGGDTNATSDVFLRDRLLGTTVRISVGAAGAQVNSSPFSNAVSADGRVVVWVDSSAVLSGDLNTAFDIYLRDTGVIAP